MGDSASGAAVNPAGGLVPVRFVHLQGPFAVIDGLPGQTGLVVVRWVAARPAPTYGGQYADALHAVAPQPGSAVEVMVRSDDGDGLPCVDLVTAKRAADGAVRTIGGQLIAGGVGVPLTTADVHQDRDLVSALATARRKEAGVWAEDCAVANTHCSTAFLQATVAGARGSLGDTWMLGIVVIGLVLVVAIVRDARYRREREEAQQNTKPTLGRRIAGVVFAPARFAAWVIGVRPGTFKPFRSSAK